MDAYITDWSANLIVPDLLFNIVGYECSEPSHTAQQRSSNLLICRPSINRYKYYHELSLVTGIWQKHIKHYQQHPQNAYFCSFTLPGGLDKNGRQVITIPGRRDQRTPISYDDLSTSLSYLEQIPR